MPSTIDSDFLSLPYSKFAQIVLELSSKNKLDYCDFRFEKLKSLNINARNLQISNFSKSSSIGYAIRLLYDGTWGFASSNVLTEKDVKETFTKALNLAKNLSQIKGYKVKLSPEPIYKDTYISKYQINPFSINPKDIVDLMIEVNKNALNTKKIEFATFNYTQVQENKYLITSEGSEITQQRIRLYPVFTVGSVNKNTGGYEDMRGGAVPAGKGYEYMLEYDFQKEAYELPEILQEKLKAPTVKPGNYDLVIDPSHLWLTIHESIGHATELDRAIGFEANYAGTSFATLDKLGKLQFGSKYVNVKADRIQDYGLATTGYDDDGVSTGEWDIIKNGTLVGYQYNREIAGMLDYKRSNGCAYADSWEHLPVQRMPNISLMPSLDNISTQDLISQVSDGFYLAGDKSWSIDQQRYNFQFTPQRCYRIKNGKITGQVRGMAYQANTLEFWNSCDGIGGKDTYILSGTFSCGKAQPGQSAPMSHGSPSALFRNVRILNG